MTPTPTTAAPDPRREEELRIQALGAALSRRKWSEVEEAYDKICDEFYRRPRAPQDATSARGGEEVAETVAGFIRELRSEEDDPDRPAHSERIAGWNAAIDRLEEMLREVRPAPEVKDAGEEKCCGKPIHDGDPERYVLACCGQPTTPAPAAASDGLVERLREEAQALSSYGHRCGSQDADISSLLAEQAADRIEADAAEMERKDARIVELIHEREEIRSQFVRECNRATAAEAERDQWKRDAGILLANIDYLEECTGEGPEGEDRALVEQIRAALRPEGEGGRDVG